MSARAIAIHGNEMSGERTWKLRASAQLWQFQRVMCPALTFTPKCSINILCTYLYSTVCCDILSYLQFAAASSLNLNLCICIFILSLSYLIFSSLISYLTYRHDVRRQLQGSRSKEKRRHLKSSFPAKFFPKY